MTGCKAARASGDARLAQHNSMPMVTAPRDMRIAQLTLFYWSCQWHRHPLRKYEYARRAVLINQGGTPKRELLRSTPQPVQPVERHTTKVLSHRFMRLPENLQEPWKMERHGGRGIVSQCGAQPNSTWHSLTVPIRAFVV